MESHRNSPNGYWSSFESAVWILIVFVRCGLAIEITKLLFSIVFIVVGLLCAAITIALIIYLDM